MTSKLQVIFTGLGDQTTGRRIWGGERGKRNTMTKKKKKGNKKIFKIGKRNFEERSNYKKEKTELFGKKNFRKKQNKEKFDKKFIKVGKRNTGRRSRGKKKGI